MSYQQCYDRSIAAPADFWAEQAAELAWFHKPTEILRTNPDGTHQWFADGRLNSCYLALDLQIEEGRGDQPALIYDSPVTGSQQTFTFKQMHDEVARLAGLLRELGVEQGDGVVIYMPMVPRRRWPCLPARGSARCIRWCSAASPRTSWPCVSTMRGRPCCSPPPAAWNSTRSSSTSRWSTGPWNRPPISRARSSSCNGRRPAPAWWKAVTSTGRPRWKTPRRCRRWSCAPPIRCTSCTPPEPPANPRALSARTAAMPWPCVLP